MDAVDPPSGPAPQRKGPRGLLRGATFAGALVASTLLLSLAAGADPAASHLLIVAAAAAALALCFASVRPWRPLAAPPKGEWQAFGGRAAKLALFFAVVCVLVAALLTAGYDPSTVFPGYAGTFALTHPLAPLLYGLVFATSATYAAGALEGMQLFIGEDSIVLALGGNFVGRVDWGAIATIVVHRGAVGRFLNQRLEVTSRSGDTLQIRENAMGGAPFALARGALVTEGRKRPEVTVEFHED